MSPKAWLPVLLGAAAAVGNYLILTEAAATTELVAVRGDRGLKPGVPITAADLVPVAARGDEPLFRGAVLYARRDAVLGKTVRRSVGAGELLLCGDVESEGYQIDHQLLGGGETSLTLPARAAALAGRPRPGVRVELIVRPVGGGTATRHGPYTFLGSVPAPSGTRDASLVYFAVGVQNEDPRLAALQQIRETGAADRVVTVEVVRPLILPNPR